MRETLPQVIVLLADHKIPARIMQSTVQYELFGLILNTIQPVTWMDASRARMVSGWFSEFLECAAFGLVSRGSHTLAP